MAIVGGKKEQGFLEKIYMGLNKPTNKNKVVLFRLLSATQNAGLGIRESLRSIAIAETHPGLKKILKDTIEQVNEGVGFSDALGKYDNFFSNSEIELIRSSEQIGQLPKTLESMSIELEKFQALKAKLKSAMMYPSVVLFIAVFAVLILLWKVIPTIVKVFPPDLELPMITQFVIASSEYIQANYMIIFGFLILLPVVFYMLYKKFLLFKILIDKIILRIPVVGPLTKTFYRYRFSKLLGDFYDAGISPLDSLIQISNIFGNYHYKKKIMDVKKDLEIGLEMSDSLEGNWLFNPILIQIIGIGEKTGNVGEVLAKMAIFYRNEVDGKLEGMAKMIEPLLMVFVAGVIGTIVASIFLPMADMIGSLS